MKNLLIKGITFVALFTALTTFAENTTTATGGTENKTRSEKKCKKGPRKRLDTNKDGKISLKEFKKNSKAKNPEKRFKEIDTNNDGNLTRDEIKAARKKRQAKGGKRKQKGQRGEKGQKQQSNES